MSRTEAQINNVTAEFTTQVKQAYFCRQTRFVELALVVSRCTGILKTNILKKKCMSMSKT